MQLRVCRLAKLLTHGSAMYRPTLRQMDHGTVLTAVAHTLHMTEEDWIVFCEQLHKDQQGALHAAILPAHQDRTRSSSMFE